MFKGVPFVEAHGRGLRPAVFEASSTGKELLLSPVCQGQYPLNLRFAHRVQTACPLTGDGLGDSVSGSVGGKASQPWWEGPGGILVRSVGSLLGDAVVFGSCPGGWQGEVCGTQSSFYPGLLGPKMNPVLFGGELRGLGLGQCLRFDQISQM